ncbi:protein of unknown function [Pseudomonas sp. JV551A1]|uniref:Uncharacterized protein n=1 Tax=Pseudomonas inefficax TaxID=2078786 RepID=A0AAQ1SU77_9PSED|nr:protein of unknown function [Pseudomonas sp. JV551A1]SPO61694.1 protein of unknown function [Pseudomonas inefficax]
MPSKRQQRYGISSQPIYSHRNQKQETDIYVFNAIFETRLWSVFFFTNKETEYSVYFW